MGEEQRDDMNDPYFEQVNSLCKALSAGDHSALAKLIDMAERYVPWCYLPVGEAYLLGRYDVSKDSSKGEHYLRLAFNAGVREAGHLLGRYFLENGAIDEAQELFERTCQNEFVPSSYQLGIGHLDNTWSKPNKELGLTLLERNAAAGHLWSMEYLSLFKARNGSMRNRDRVRHLLSFWRSKIMLKIYLKFFRTSPRVQL